MPLIIIDNGFHYLDSLGNITNVTVNKYFNQDLQGGRDS